MERSDRISIGHYAFSLDGNALKSIKEYLGKLESHYLRQPDGAEIMDSIEARIAELLYERCGSERVVSEEDIRYVIGILGYPEDLGNISDGGNPTGKDGKPVHTDEVNSYSQAEGGYAKDNRKRRLYRDMENRQVNGVCAGLSNALDIDAIWLRLAFLIPVILSLVLFSCGVNNAWHSIAMFLLFFTPILYLTLTFCMPKAVTVKQKYEMRGESGSVNDISRNRKERESENSDNRRRGPGCLAVCVGLFLLFIGLNGLIIKIVTFGSLAVATNASFGMMSWLPGADLLESVIGLAPFARILVNPFVQVMWYLIILIPSILFLYGGIVLLFDTRTPKWRPGLCLLILWLMLIVAMVPISFFTSRHAVKSIENEIRTTLNLTGDIVKDYHLISDWLKEHNFDEDELREFEEWMDEHNLDEENIEELQQWLYDHNFSSVNIKVIRGGDSLYLPDEKNDTLWPVETGEGSDTLWTIEPSEND